MREYPLLVIDTVQHARYFQLALNDRFPEIHFIIRKYEGKLRVDPIDDVSDVRYLQVYQYAQKLFIEYYEDENES